MFVYWREGNAGSAQTILKYTEAAKTLGHEVVMYGPEDEKSRFKCSLDAESADAVIFVLEWNMYLHPGGQKKQGRRLRDGLMGVGHLNIVKLVSKLPRKRRVIIDNDGMYNDVIRIDGDYNNQVVNPYAANAGANPLQIGVVALSLGSDQSGGVGSADKNVGYASDDVISWQ